MKSIKDYGFKIIDKNNWQQRDDILKVFRRKNMSVTGEEWLEAIMEPKLTDSVPLELQKLFEVARGVMVYAYFFYPLFTVSLEQFSRIFETAVNMKCKSCNCPKQIKSFKNKIDWLYEQETITETQHFKWHSIRELRNHSSHPEKQSIYAPGISIGFLASVAKEINLIFLKGDGNE